MGGKYGQRYRYATHITKVFVKEQSYFCSVHVAKKPSANTDDASIVGLSPLNWAIVLLSCMLHALTRDHYRTSCMDVKWRVCETLQCEQIGRLELAWSQVSL